MKRYLVLAVAAFAAGACTTSPENSFAAGRTVFDNPYVAPIPSEPSDESGGLFYPGAGRYAFDSEGNRVELTKSERRDARERARLVGQQAEQNELVREFDAREDVVPPPVPSAPPIAIDAQPR